MRSDCRQRLDHFAELLSIDLPISEIRERMGLSKRCAYAMLSRLRAILGPQAQ